MDGAPWYLYVVECRDNSLYTGITNNLARRLRQHNAGRGAAYTTTRRPVILVGVWRFADRSAALKAEFHFKQQPRSQKLQKIAAKEAFLGAEFVELA